jgi:DNA-binding PadR family transcriptional regulator
VARPPSPLDGVVLGLLVERPGYGYDLGKRLDERMGPGWKLSPSTIYMALDRLEAKRCVSSELHELEGRPRSRERVLYRSTPEGTKEYVRWLSSPVRKEPVRLDVLARIAVAAPEHAPLLLTALDGYEAECLDMLTSASGHAAESCDGWEAVVVGGIEESILEHLHAELRWVKSMRRRIAEFAQTHLED